MSILKSLYEYFEYFEALKSSSFSSSREIVNDSDLELVAIELRTTCNQK